MMRHKSFVLFVLLLLTLNVSAQTSKIEIADPEVFELANVAFALTEFSATNPDMTERRGDYYARVAEHFGAYKNHALVRLLDEKGKKIIRII